MADTQIYSSPWSALLDRRIVPPAPALYLREGDVLYIEARAWTADTEFFVSGTYLRADGEVDVFQRNFVVTVATGTGQGTIRLGECILLSLVVETDAGALFHGDAHALVYAGPVDPSYLVVTAVLVQGAVNNASNLAWPGSPLEPRVTGAGRLAVITGSDPAAGAEISYQIGSYQRWRLRAMVATLVTGAAAATRQVHLQIVSHSATVLDLPSATTQIISLTRTYYAAPFGFQPGAVLTDIFLPLPMDFILPPSATIQTATDNLNALDDWSAPVFYAEVWHEN